MNLGKLLFIVVLVLVVVGAVIWKAGGLGLRFPHVIRHRPACCGH